MLEPVPVPKERDWLWHAVLAVAPNPVQEGQWPRKALFSGTFRCAATALRDRRGAVSSRALPRFAGRQKSPDLNTGGVPRQRARRW
jgi:hypothetical protein